MTREEIKDKLRELLKKQISLSDGTEVTEATAFTDLGVDSLAMLDVIYEVEEAFGVEIIDSELVELKAVSHLIDVIEKKTAGT